MNVTVRPGARAAGGWRCRRPGFRPGARWRARRRTGRRAWRGGGPGVALLMAPALWLLLLGLQHAMPRLLRSREYNPLLVAFVALLLASAVGWVGLVLAPGVAAAIQITIEAVLRERDAAAATPATTGDIRERYEILAATALAKQQTSRRTLGLLANLGTLKIGRAHV